VFLGIKLGFGSRLANKVRSSLKLLSDLILIAIIYVNLLLLDVLRDMLPEGNQIAESVYEVKKIICPLE
jgi:hypothetical protein